MSNLAQTSLALRKKRTPRGNERRNQYECGIEVNQNGKYAVRIRATYGRNGWVLPLYFLASSFDAAMKKLEQSLQALQREEERLCFWGVERSDDPNLAGELLGDFGLRLDRRSDFPAKPYGVVVATGRPIPAFRFAQLRRVLADSITTRRAALASD